MQKVLVCGKQNAKIIEHRTFICEKVRIITRYGQKLNKNTTLDNLGAQRTENWL